MVENVETKEENIHCKTDFLEIFCNDLRLNPEHNKYITLYVKMNTPVKNAKVGVSILFDSIIYFLKYELTDTKIITPIIAKNTDLFIYLIHDKTNLNYLNYFLNNSNFFK